MHTSLLFQIVTFFNLWFLGFFSILELAALFFKRVYLPYPPSYLACDVILIILSLLVEFLRIHLSRNGNLTERQIPILASLAFSFTSVLGSVYILLWQTYVLRLEIIFSCIQAAFQGFEIFYCCVLVIGFHKKSSPV